MRVKKHLLGNFVKHGYRIIVKTESKRERKIVLPENNVLIGPYSRVVIGDLIGAGKGVRG